MVRTYLVTRVRSAEKVRDGSTSNSRSRTSITALHRADGSDRKLFLTEASLNVGDDCRDDKDLGNHVC